MKNEMERKNPATIALIVLIIAAIGYFAFWSIGRWHKKEIDAEIDRHAEAWQTETDALIAKIAILEEELRLQKEELFSEEKLIEAFGKESALIFHHKKTDCQILEQQIEAFFSYLDQKNYIKAYNLENGMLGLFENMQNKLTEMLPTIIWETRDLFTLLRNLAHFNRVLGKNNLKLIKDILKNESEVIEPAMEIFYAWFTHENCSVGKINPPALKTLYEYSGFFLNTIAGRSYLFRRDSKVRVLVSYYSVLTLERANQEALNPYGIDIRPFISSLYNDLWNRKGLIYQKEYLSELETLIKKYQL